jgi:hypothetical protein
MDLTHDNLSLADTGIPGGAVVDSLASSAKNLAAGIRNKAKAKSAKAVSDAGDYWTLRPFLKSLIPVPQYVLDQVGGQGITEQQVLDIPEFSKGTPTATIIAKITGQAAKSSIGAGGVISAATTSVSAATEKTLASDAASSFKQYIPYIVVIGIVLIVIYIVMKNKK